jgi:hypothetical protein
MRADWLLHRRTRIQDNAGARESAIHLAMQRTPKTP